MSLTCPFIDPVLFKIGPFQSSWYGLMYATGAVLWYLITRHEIIRRKGPIPVYALPELLFYGLVGGIIGARLGYALFYNLSFFMQKPWEIVAFWHGGMSAHGWLIGMSVGGFIFIAKHRVPLRELSDVVYLGIPLGLVTVKIGNFINCEGFGRVTTMPWGVICPGGGPLSRHPSQLYEAVFEGLLLFVILWRVRTMPLKPGDLSCFFLIGYGILRFIIEFTTQPDQYWGGLTGWMTAGQVLSVFVIGVGVVGYALPRLKRLKSD
jgi:phosphatidylglycerol:prolipoprotein diacylglycerol transferase